MLKKPPKISAASLGESEDSDEPLGAKLSKEKTQIEKSAAKEARIIRKDDAKPLPKGTKKPKREESDEDDDIPIAKKRQSVTSSSSKKRSSSAKKTDLEEEGLHARKTLKNAKASMKSAAPVKQRSKVKAEKEENKNEEEAEDEEEEYRWWEDPQKSDGSIKWTTLEHAGVVFPPPYQPLPKNVHMLYDGEPITMDPAAEEVAGFFGAMLSSTVNVENPTFCKNFFEDFTAVLAETGGAKDLRGAKVKVKEFSRCNFTPIFEHYEALRLAKKSLTSAEKKAAKVEKDELEAPYAYCLWDGRKQKVGNFRVEPPGLFRGRGEHPKTGRVKKRVQPEQITINIGKEAPIPKAPAGHKWKEVRHDQTGTWLVMWQENINNAYKYVMLAANSDIKGQSDFKKFEKARELKVRRTQITCYNPLTIRETH